MYDSVDAMRLRRNVPTFIEETKRDNQFTDSATSLQDIFSGLFNKIINRDHQKAVSSCAPGQSIWRNFNDIHFLIILKLNVKTKFLLDLLDIFK